MRAWLTVPLLAGVACGAALPLACGARSDLGVVEEHTGDAGAGAPLDAAVDSGLDAPVDAPMDAFDRCGPLEPVPIAFDDTGLFDVVLDQTHAYFANTDQGTLKKVDLCSGEVTTLATGGAFGVAVDATHLYWTNATLGGGVSRVSIHGGASELVWQLASGQPEDVVVDATHVYFTVVATLGNDPEGLYRAEKNGSAPTVLYQGQVWRPLAVDDAWVYFGIAGFGVNIVRLPKGGGATEHLGSSEAVGDIALDSTHVYWSSWNGNENVLRAPKSGGTVEVLAAGELGAVSGVAVDDSLVFWTEEGFNPGWGRARAAPKSGGNALDIRDGLDVPERIAVNESFVVWVNFGNGEVWRARH